jgi:glycosyltransferase involved in cell wall biosynthesis
MIERVSASYADHVIIANHIWLEKITARSVAAEKCSAFLNYPDPLVFHSGLRKRTRDTTFVVVYPGTLNWHQGLDIAVKAVSLLGDSVPKFELHIYGEGSSKTPVEKLAAKLGLEGRVIFHDPLPLREIAGIMANADLGLVPKRNNSFGGEAFSTKILEFMALGVPVVVANTTIDKYYFDESVVRFFNAGDEQDLALVLRESYECRQQGLQRAAKALEFVQTMSWESKQGEYLSLVNTLACKSGGN